MKALRLLPVLLAAATLSACSSTEKTDNATNTKDTAVLKSDANPPVANQPAADRWHDVDWNSPVIKYDEIKGNDVEVRGNDRYSIYSLGENVLFSTGKADIRKEAEANLSSVVASINQHYAGGYVKVYGYTDSTGSTAENNKLSAQRAQAVAAWLTGNGKMAADKVSAYAEGEARPLASNGSAAGRQMNRRVEIVVTK